jgi:hypothetical protein
MTSNAGPNSPSFPVRFADIIFARNVLDPSGQNPKDRRVVVLTPDVHLALGSPIIAAAVTGSIPQALPPDYVLLPYKNPPGTRHPKTGTTKKAAVVCTWLVVVDPGDIVGRSGFVPDPPMSIVQSKAGAAAKVIGGWT